MSSDGIGRNFGGRPATGKGRQVVVRMHDPLLAALDIFAAEHEGEIGRPEAVRRALTDHLRAKGYLPTAGSG